MDLAREVEACVLAALREDRAEHDATTLAVVPAGARTSGRILARESGILAGRDYASAAFRACDAGVELDWRGADGDRLGPGQLVLVCRGLAAGLLAAERTALNFLQQLSGVATATAALVAALGPGIAVLDTRKTVPGLRDAQKQAVVAGGGVNHRRDLDDQLLLKENHFALSGLTYGATVERARAAAAGRVVGAEARSVEQALAALDAGADYVLLDNFAPATLADAVARLRQLHPAARIEVSGGIRPDNAVSLRGAGVDRVSAGWLTHSAPALDLSFYLAEIPLEEASRA